MNLSPGVMKIRHLSPTEWRSPLTLMNMATKQYFTGLRLFIEIIMSPLTLLFYKIVFPFGLIVGEQDSRIVGLTIWNPTLKPGVCEVLYTAVEPEFQGRGVATGIYTEVHRRQRALGFRHVCMRARSKLLMPRLRMCGIFNVRR